MSADQRIAFANNLKYYMEMRHVEQSDIVSALNISASTVSDWVNGKKYPRVEAQQKLADFLGVSIVSLVGGETVSSPNDVFSSFDFERVATLLEGKNMSLGDLAAAIGLKPSALEFIKRPGAVPSTPVLYKMADALDCSVDYLLGLTDEVNPVTSQRLNSDELDLVGIYRDLNDLGQSTLMGTARGLAANPDMKKDGTSNSKTTT